MGNWKLSPPPHGYTFSKKIASKFQPQPGCTPHDLKCSPMVRVNDDNEKDDDFCILPGTIPFEPRETLHLHRKCTLESERCAEDTCDQF